jgi:hypothetical protein
MYLYHFLIFLLKRVVNDHFVERPATVLFQTMRSQDHDVIVVRHTINLGYWEFGMGRG